MLYRCYIDAKSMLSKGSWPDRNNLPSGHFILLGRLIKMKDPVDHVLRQLV